MASVRSATLHVTVKKMMLLKDFNSFTSILKLTHSFWYITVQGDTEVNESQQSIQTVHSSFTEIHDNNFKEPLKSFDVIKSNAIQNRLLLLLAKSQG